MKRNRIGKNGPENQSSALEDIIGLLECPSIAVVDLSDNYIDDPEILPQVLAKMPKLSVLYLQGNPVTKLIKNYRKVLITSIPTLKYLDDRPVFEDDRRAAEAFSRGGFDEERKERDKIRKEKDDEHWKNHEAFQDMIKRARAEKKQAEEDAKTKKEQEASLNEV